MKSTSPCFHWGERSSGAVISTFRTLPFCCHPSHPRGVGQDILKHQGVDVHQTGLQEMQGEHRQLLVVEPIGRDLATFPVEDEAVGAIPVRSISHTL